MCKESEKHGDGEKDVRGSPEPRDGEGRNALRERWEENGAEKGDHGK